MGDKYQIGEARELSKSNEVTEEELDKMWRRQFDTLTDHDKYQYILEWMYTNDGAFETREDWRIAFIDMLKFILDIT